MEDPIATLDAEFHAIKIALAARGVPFDIKKIEDALAALKSGKATQQADVAKLETDSK